MIRQVRLLCGFAAALLFVSVSGCVPSEQGEAEEAREPHFVDGKAHVNSMDYEGAIDEFKKALKVNPESASAHYELGWLYEQKVPDPAAAIYHYQSYLQLRPAADNAELIKQRITSCKQDLAKTVPAAANNPKCAATTRSANRRSEAITGGKREVEDLFRELVSRNDQCSCACRGPNERCNGVQFVFVAQPGTINIAKSPRPPGCSLTDAHHPAR